MDKLKKVGIGIGGFFLLIIVTSMASENIQQGIKEAVENTVQSFESAQKAEEQLKQTTYTIGDNVTLDGISYMVTDSPTRTTGDAFKKADGIFYRIPLKMENLGKQSKSVFNKQFTLIDSKNREYKVDSSWFNYSKDLVGGEGLSPNLPIERGIYFDIPYEGELQYKLKIKPWGKISFSYEIICVENC